MEPIRLVTFYDLLGQGYSVAQLATAVETHGVSGWDRFGRFGDFAPPPKGEGARAALDALAHYLDFVDRFYEERDAANEPDGPIDLTPALVMYEGDRGAAIHRFGWPPDKVPVMDSPTSHPPAPRPRLRDSGPRNALLLLGAVLDYLSRRDRPPSQAQVIDDISGRYSDVYGLKAAALEKWFAEANKEFRAAIPQKAP